MKATLQYAITSYKKMLIIAKLVQKKKVTEALPMLQLIPNKAAWLLASVIKSATANAKQKWQDITNLRIARIDIGRWPKLARMRFVARSRVHGYIKHRTFVRVSLDVW